MSASSLVSGIPGVRGYTVADSTGKVVEPLAAKTENEPSAAAASLLGRGLAQVTSLLQLGAPRLVSTKGPEAAWVIAYRGEMCMAVELDPNRPLTQIESLLLTSDWSVQSEWTVSDSEIDYAPPRALPPVPPPPNPAPPPSIPGSHQAPPIATARSPRPPGLGRNGAPEEGALGRDSAVTMSARRVTPDGSRTKPAKTVSVAAECKGLRRALIQGQLTRAETIAARLRELPPADREPSGVGASEQFLRPLLDGVASVLSGDNHGGLKSLALVGDQEKVGSSIKWVTEIWSARALIGTVDGLASAGTHAESALVLATQLDDEARAISALLWAEIALLQGEFDRAIALTRNARELLIGIGDHQELASGWLLEARILSASGREAESVQAAERAHQYRPSWHPPATFIAKSALGAGRLAEAEQVLKPLFNRAPVAPEVERSRKLLERVRSGLVPGAVVADFLRLLDALPSVQTLRNLEEIAERFPRIEHFREALGWKLLRAGDYDGATRSFQQLSSRADLPDDVRSSVLLGLGCLAAVEARHDKTGVKLRATVNAAPKNMPHVQPVPPSQAKIPKANPVEFRSVTTPNAVALGFPPEETRTSPRRVQGGPVFAGSLQVFCLPDLLEFLRTGQKTGTLVCSSVAGIGAIHMRSGRVTGAVAPSTKGLREYLLEQGTATTDQLRAAGTEQDKTTPRPLIGGVLVREGLATPDQIRRALRAQIQDAIRELLNWGEGQFAFDPEATVDPSASDVEVALDPQGILLEIFRELDESSRAAP